jgi:AcrR family transcriptional regulator
MSMLMTEPARSGLWERSKKAKLGRIERAARMLFSKKGFAETTTREIARRPDIGVGTLFLYFPEKRDLLFHLFRQEIEPIVDRAF